MEMYTKANGLMIKLMDKVFIHIQMAVDMKVIGKKTNSMAKELRDGQMVLHMKVSMLEERNTAMVNLFGQIIPPSMANS